jgi:hypothetical protein
MVAGLGGNSVQPQLDDIIQDLVQQFGKMEHDARERSPVRTEYWRGYDDGEADAFCRACDMLHAALEASGND